jgi:hypothetical protein
MREIFARFDKYMRHKGLNDNQVTIQCELSQGLIGQARTGKSDLGKKTIDKILKVYQDLNRVWLLTGNGEMLNSEGNIAHLAHAGIPFYKDVPVSAGRADLMSIRSEEIPDGFIKITGVYGQFAFPVIGCSMEPVIHAGDIVVVDEINNWERIDPDKIYLIFTHDDRMIKHLEIDDMNDEILWCVSPNYKKFSLPKSEIKQIYKVTFYGRLA